MPPVAVVALVLIIGMAVFADLLAPHSPYTTSLADRLHPPFWLEGGASTYLLGTDQLGRDVLSRIVFGARSSLIVATVALLLAGGMGTGVGLVSGYFGGKTDAFLMRIVDATLGLPIILIALLLAVSLGPSLLTVVVAVGSIVWARYARMIRGEVLALRKREFVIAAWVVGCSNLRIIALHILPNIVNTLVVLLTLQVGWVIIVEASLGFLGAGVPPPTPSWGSMVAAGRDRLTTAWWVPVFPAIVIGVTVLAFNMFGEWMRDALDPRLRNL